MVTNHIKSTVRNRANHIPCLTLVNNNPRCDLKSQSNLMRILQNLRELWDALGLCLDSVLVKKQTHVVDVLYSLSWLQGPVQCLFLLGLAWRTCQMPLCCAQAPLWSWPGMSWSSKFVVHTAAQASFMASFSRCLYA